MAVYAIGDIQGCYDPLQRLLEYCAFDPDKDTLWLTGDLVNRGPKSLKTLRFVRSLGDAAITVLGNHDLHLLALAAGKISAENRFSTMQKVLLAPDRDELIDWLRHRPLAHYDESLDTLLVHAGVHPAWSVKKTLTLAAEVEAALRGDQCYTLLEKMYGNTPATWSPRLTGYKRMRFVINCLTRMRMMTLKGKINFAHSGSPFNARKNLLPWFDYPERVTTTSRVAFGHWSSLGLVVLPNLLSLDSGCVWGRQLTAVRLDKQVPRLYQVPGEVIY